MRRFRLWALAAVVVAVVALVVINTVAADQGPKSIVGTWSGALTDESGSHPARQHFTIVVYKGERAGRWRTNAHCAGTFRLQNISNGYHHYYRVAGSNRGCVVLGVDCLKRDGARMEDEFVPVASAEAANSSGQFRRLS